MSGLEGLTSLLPWFVALLVVVVVVGLGVGFLGGGTGRRPGRDINTQRERSTIWAQPGDVAELVVDPRKPWDTRRLALGMLGGKQLASPPLRSKIIIAPTQAGKTARVMVPDILRHTGPALIASVKADIRELTAHQRRQVGPVWVMDPLEPATSMRWSPLWSIQDWADALDAARWIQESSRASSSGLDNEAFWDSQSRYLLGPLLYLAARNGHTMSHVVSWVSNLDEQLEERIATDLHTVGDAGPRDDWAAFRQIHDKTKSSIITTARTVLEAWRHPRAQAVIGVVAGEQDARVLDLDELLDNNGTLYLVCPRSEQRQLAPVFETLVNAVLLAVERRYQRSGRPLDPPLLLGLDETANIAPLRDLDQIASEKTAQGVILVTVWQSEGQIRERYGPDRTRTILANHTAKTYLAGNTDHETLEHLSRMIGRAEFAQSSRSTQLASTAGLYHATGGGRSIQESVHEADVAPPDRLRQMDADEAVVIVNAFKPMRVHLPAWYEDKTMRALIDPDVAAALDAYYAPASSGGRRSRPSARKASR